MFDFGASDRFLRHRERMAQIEAARDRQPPPYAVRVPAQLSWPDPDAQARHTEAWAKGRRAAELEHEAAHQASDPEDAALREHIARVLHDAATGRITPDEDDPTPYGHMAAQILREFDVHPRSDHGP